LKFFPNEYFQYNVKAFMIFQFKCMMQLVNFSDFLEKAECKWWKNY